jgi:hypothetical protein
MKISYRISESNITKYFLVLLRIARQQHKIAVVAVVVEGHALAQLVEAPRNKPEGRGFSSRWCHWNFSLTILPAAL